MHPTPACRARAPDTQPNALPPHEAKNDDIDYQRVVPIWIQGPKARNMVWGNSLYEPELTVAFGEVAPGPREVRGTNKIMIKRKIHPPQWLCYGGRVKIMKGGLVG